MDVDKIHPFSSTLGWHGLKIKVKGEIQTRKGLRWIPRHPETRKVHSTTKRMEVRVYRGATKEKTIRSVAIKHWCGKTVNGIDCSTKSIIPI
jgi:hypothetical protein